MVNEKLAQTFEAISKDRDAFYKLPMAQERLSDSPILNFIYFIEFYINIKIFNLLELCRA